MDNREKPRLRQFAEKFADASGDVEERRFSAA
jgi:hypothetical protein